MRKETRNETEGQICVDYDTKISDDTLVLGSYTSMVQTLAPIAFLGSFALAVSALQSALQQHCESLGPILRNVELGALPTQRALCAARDELDPKAREVLPPFDVSVSTPPPRLQAALHVATCAARFDEVLAGASC